MCPGTGVCRAEETTSHCKPLSWISKTYTGGSETCSVCTQKKKKIILCCSYLESLWKTNHIPKNPPHQTQKAIQPPFIATPLFAKKFKHTGSIFTFRITWGKQMKTCNRWVNSKYPENILPTCLLKLNTEGKNWASQCSIVLNYHIL